METFLSLSHHTAANENNRACGRWHTKNSVTIPAPKSIVKANTPVVRRTRTVRQPRGNTCSGKATSGRESSCGSPLFWYSSRQGTVYYGPGWRNGHETCSISSADINPRHPRHPRQDRGVLLLRHARHSSSRHLPERRLWCGPGKDAPPGYRSPGRHRRKGLESHGQSSASSLCAPVA